MGKLAATGRRRLKSLNHSLTLDCVSTAPTRAVLATYARPRVEKLLEERGLARSAAKPRIVHSKAGLHCRGFHIRQCGKQGTLLTVPQQEKVLKHGRAIRS